MIYFRWFPALVTFGVCVHLGIGMWWMLLLILMSGVLYIREK